MENTKYGGRREGRWTPIRAKAQDTRANPNSWETYLVRKRWNIGPLLALSPRMMMMMINAQVLGLRLWNSLPSQVQKAKSIGSFKAQLKSILVS